MPKRKASTNPFAEPGMKYAGKNAMPVVPPTGANTTNKASEGRPPGKKNVARLAPVRPGKKKG